LGFLHQYAFFIVKSFASIKLSDSAQQLQQEQEHCFNFYSGFGRAAGFMFLVRWIPDPPDQISIIYFFY
jgi:hypothetical protein